MCPYPVIAVKPGLFPERFEIPEPEMGKLSVLHVGSNHFNVPIPLSNGRSIKSRVPAEELAESIVQDHLHSLIGFSEESHPVLFWVPGKLTAEEVEKNHSVLLSKYKEKQTRWYKKLVETADDDWSKNRARRAITQQQKKAAHALGLKREWSLDNLPEEVISAKCPACFDEVHPDAIICRTCKTNIVQFKLENSKKK
jgi:hypothetical protein